MRLNVDVIEAGFPAASPGDWEAVNRTPEETRGVAVAGLARCRDGDPNEPSRRCAWPSGRTSTSSSRRARSTSAPDPDDPRRGPGRGGPLGPLRTRAAGRDAELEFSAMDATRSDPDYLMQVVAAVVEAGATTVNLPDTVGYRYPRSSARLSGGPLTSSGPTPSSASTATTTWVSPSRTPSPRSRPARARWR